MSRFNGMSLQELQHEYEQLMPALEKAKEARRAELRAELEKLDGPSRSSALAAGGRTVRVSRPQYRLPDGEEVFRKGPFRGDLKKKGYSSYEDLEPYRINYDKAGKEIPKK